ncbi:MAG: NADH-quinone oxidoreductase subunit NuoE [Hyphomicrobiales bacterium]
MAVRRIAEEQPASFAFDKGNLKWANDQIGKFPKGKQASAVIPLLWRAQEQHNGWLPEPAMRYIGDMLEMPFIRVLEVATFYTMFQLKPVGSVAHIQVCGTTPCMLRGSEDLMKVCKSRISPNQHEVTADGKYSWEEVECLGACVNAPMVQIFKDTFEDLTPETFEKMLDDIEAGREVKPGPQTERHLSVHSEGRTQLHEGALDYGPEANPYIAPYVMNGNAAMIDNDARDSGLATGAAKKRAPAKKAAPAKAASTKAAAPKKASASKPAAKATAAKSASKTPASKTPAAKTAAPKAAAAKAAPAKVKAPTKAELAKEETAAVAALAALPKGASAEDRANAVGKKPRGTPQPRKSGADDLKLIKGVGPVIETKLNDKGIWHFDQIAKWDRGAVQWFDQFLNFKGRIDRDTWLKQAVILAAGGETEFSKRSAKTTKKGK